MPDLMQAVLGGMLDDLRVEIYDSALPGDGNWMYVSSPGFRALSLEARDAPAYALLRRAEAGGHVWTLYFEATPRFLAGIDRSTPLAVIGAGLLITLVLTLFTAKLLVSESRAQEASLRDSLTGLYNRRFLDETLGREEERARRYGGTIGVIQFDLDRFKDLNDSRGHDAGDALLQAVARLIESQTRGEDVACRYGGEEITVVLPGASLADAQARAEQLRVGIAALEVVHRGEKLPTVTTSAGVAAFPQHGEDMVSVLRQADQALLRAKNEGRNRVIVA
jgi:diguanylate cyclase (GGDEF)-like protein